MKITEVRVSIPKTELKSIAAFVDIIIDECFAVHGLRIVKGEKGLFVVMPSQRVKEEFTDVCHPINKETREMINTTVLEAYEKKLAEADEAAAVAE